ncbi:hypothetical protein BN2475_580065 [Paraburkholderia ribeironis]|uniref:Transposase n=1 Tax=Paraburkholderia ribeironis TaxID=1247936 RepID=A0A1N7SE68_9BURK|nr:hypothetical protein BN2475_580065 [Paraburkholderia ribeironis]
MKFAWTDTHCRQYPLSALREVLCMSINDYRAWKLGGAAERQRCIDAQWLTVIRAIHAEIKRCLRLAAYERGSSFSRLSDQQGTRETAE